MQKNSKAILVLISVIFILFTMYNLSNQTAKTPIDKDYTKLLESIRTNKISSVELMDYKLTERKVKVTPKDGEPFVIHTPKDSLLTSELDKHNVQTYVIPEPIPSGFSTFLSTWGPTLLIIGVWIFFMFKMQGGGKGGIFKFGKNKAELLDPSQIKETFDDVIGCDEAKLEVQEFEEFLKNPEKFSKLGGTIPRGVLFSGPSGTGKTLLAKALAKSSGVPFFFISGSDFVEMFVGVGAARVRDMFETAKKAAPCILFIDEIDAIGRARSSGGGFGGNEEREQTLNQILVELDGMKGNQGIILVGATNRPEILDAALLRPGRFDRQITVGLPDVKGREAILKLHSKNSPVLDGVDFFKIARGTPGFSGAELKNVINEAAIFAARRSKKFIEQSDLEDAKDKIMLGLARHSMAMTEEEKRDTAYHESGHAIIARLLPNSDPVYKVTIVPRGQALGLTVQLPEKDRHSYKKEYLKNRIAILMGGRAAEEIFCNTLTSGASNDIKVASSTARSMIMQLGMSSLGPVAFGNSENNSLNTSFLSQKTLETVDAEVSELINSQYKLAFDLLTTHRDKVEAMTQALMEVETIDDWQVENIMNGKHYQDKEGEKFFKIEQEQRYNQYLNETKRTDPKFVPVNIPLINVKE